MTMTQVDPLRRLDRCVHVTAVSLEISSAAVSMLGTSPPVDNYPWKSLRLVRLDPPSTHAYVTRWSS